MSKVPILEESRLCEKSANCVIKAEIKLLLCFIGKIEN